MNETVIRINKITGEENQVTVEVAAKEIYQSGDWTLTKMETKRQLRETGMMWTRFATFEYIPKTEKQA